MLRIKVYGWCGLEETESKERFKKEEVVESRYHGRLACRLGLSFLSQCCLRHYGAGRLQMVFATLWLVVLFGFACDKEGLQAAPITVSRGLSHSFL